MSFLAHIRAAEYTFRHPGHAVRASETKEFCVMSRGLAVLVSIIVFMHSGLAALEYAHAANSLFA